MEFLRNAARRLAFWALYVLTFFFAFQWVEHRYDRIFYAFWCLLSGGGAVWFLYAIRRSRRAAEQRAHAERQVAALRLAEAEGGRLTVTRTAARLGWPVRVSLATLQSLEDGLRVTTLTTVDGVRVYEFPELMHASSAGRVAGARMPPPAVTRPAASEQDSPALAEG